MGAKHGFKKQLFEFTIFLIILITLISIIFLIEKQTKKSRIDLVNENLEKFSSFELEEIGFKKIKNPITFEDGMKYLEKAALQGSSTAAKEVGLRYAWGNGVPQDKWKAQSFLQLSYDEASRYTLGTLIFEEAQSEFQYKEAYDCFRSAKYGAYDNYSEYMLGYMNYYGLGTLKNYKLAYEYFVASTKRPNSDTTYGADMLGLGHAKYYLGIMSMEGLGCKKDNRKAEWYFTSCIMSNACDFMLGVMHYKGLCERSSKKMAAYYIKKAYDGEAFNNHDREFKSRARQFWDDKELWRYHEESTNTGFNGLFN
jgi:TPR repeat protein